MGVREDCRHYLHRSTASGEVVQRCRLSVNTEGPFGCPADCVFFESRAFAGAGWTMPTTERMSNTADRLNTLPPAKRKRGRKKRS